MRGFSLRWVIASSILAASSAMSTHPLEQRPPNLHNLFHVPSFAGIGVTSILAAPTSRSTEEATAFFVGTKRGKVKQVTMTPSCLDEISVLVNDVQDANGKALKPYPIFSMMSVPKSSDAHSHHLLTGGGDRYVTVWETVDENSDSSVEKENQTRWHVKTQLGPHTGWVKDLSYSYQPSTKDGSMVFSIGCNCIEVWKIANSEYQHYCKLQIESSVEMGSTLSSDLLCLATYSYSCDGGNRDGDDNTQNENSCSPAYLVAGGVDGRLHRWALHESFAHAGVSSAHDGRVNGIVVCKDLNMLVSIGSDASVQCREIGAIPFEAWSVTSLNLEAEGIWRGGEGSGSDSDASSVSVKITSLCVVLEDSNRAIAAIGTACGKVLLVEIVRCDTNVSVSLLKEHIIEFEHAGAIHALQSFRTRDYSYRITIGHSDGLSVWDVSLP